MNHNEWTIAMDLGDRKSVTMAMNEATGEVIEGAFAMTEADLRSFLDGFEGGDVVFEAGGHSRWVKRVAVDMGFHVVVADPRRLALVTKSATKNDQNDAFRLLQLAKAPLDLMNPVELRTDAQQTDLSVARARDSLVSVRTQLVNMTRGMVKSEGGRLRRCGAETFHKLRGEVSEHLKPVLDPIFDQVEILTKQIRSYDRVIEQLCKERYPETARLLAIRGVGPLTALVFVLTLGRHERFAKSRSVAAYLGLCPRQHESGSIRRELGITKAGDRHLRRLLVQAAHYILGPFGEDCDLRRFGFRLMARGGKAAKKRAAVAVARKLAVLMHRLWADGNEYEQLRNHKTAA